MDSRDHLADRGNPATNNLIGHDIADRDASLRRVSAAIRRDMVRFDRAADGHDSATLRVVEVARFAIQSSALRGHSSHRDEPLAFGATLTGG